MLYTYQREVIEAVKRWSEVPSRENVSDGHIVTHKECLPLVPRTLSRPLLVLIDRHSPFAT